MEVIMFFCTVAVAIYLGFQYIIYSNEKRSELINDEEYFKKHSPMFRKFLDTKFDSSFSVDFRHFGITNKTHEELETQISLIKANKNEMQLVKENEEKARKSAIERERFRKKNAFIVFQELDSLVRVFKYDDILEEEIIIERMEAIWGKNNPIIMKKIKLWKEYYILRETDSDSLNSNSKGLKFRILIYDIDHPFELDEKGGSKIIKFNEYRDDYLKGLL